MFKQKCRGLQSIAEGVLTKISENFEHLDKCVKNWNRQVATNTKQVHLRFYFFLTK